MVMSKMFSNLHVILVLLPCTVSICGNLETRIVEGNNARISSFPHAAYLDVKCQARWICGSSLITQRILITAGHCLYDCNEVSRKKIFVYAGSANVKKAATLRTIIKYVVHGDFQEREAINDISLGLLDRNYELNHKIKRAIVPAYFPMTKDAYVAGWGIVDDKSNKLATVLKYAHQRVLSHASCSKLGDLSPGMFCAGNGGGHPSRGDSGNGLMTANHELIGVVSFRIPLYPKVMVYSNITYYYDWINYSSVLLYCHK